MQPTEYQPDSYQAACLKTWYQPDDPRYLDPRHPLIKLAGEAGELLDLFGKHEYKPGFDWWDCKHCKELVGFHLPNNNPSCQDFTPLVLDELGDWWYYARIITWQQGVSIANWTKKAKVIDSKDILYKLSRINSICSRILESYALTGKFHKSHIKKLEIAILWFLDLLLGLDYSLDHLTELNYAKLNSEPSAHGWKAK